MEEISVLQGVEKETYALQGERFLDRIARAKALKWEPENVCEEQQGHHYGWSREQV